MRRTLPGRHGRQKGQTLVEFALIFPLFLLLVFAVIEFAFVFSSMLGISYATRDAALIAAEAGPNTGADCEILKAVEKAVGAPADENRIQSVVIYRARADGAEMSGISNTWERGSYECPDKTTIPYQQTSNGYPEEDRCNVIVGCGGDQITLDTIGVRITYDHQWVTPLGGFPGPGFGGQGGSGFELTQSNSMRMEPIL